VADAFDAMTTNRRYRTKLDIAHAKEQLINGSGTQFDAKIVKVFIDEIIDHTSEVMKDIEHTYVGLPRKILPEKISP
jgi:HD-GYP domain-containing protein (c-di-GMP phosphodiesterase class II)